MRIRSIKPEFWTSENVADLPDDFTRLLFVGLWNYADDHGRGRDDPRLIKAALFPLTDSIQAAIVNDAMWTLAEAGLISRYDDNGRHLYEIPKWSDHQRVNRPSDSRYIPFSEGAVRTRESLTEGSSAVDNCELEGSLLEVEQGTGSMEGNREQGTAAPDGAVLAEALLDSASITQHNLRVIVDKDSRWDAISDAALMRLGQTYGPDVVITAVAFVSEGELSALKPYPYLESICLRIATERGEGTG